MAAARSQVRPRSVDMEIALAVVGQPGYAAARHRDQYLLPRELDDRKLRSGAERQHADQFDRAALLLPAADRHAHLDALPQPQAAPRHAADDRQQDQQPQDIVEHQPLRSNPVSARSGATTSATWMP